jgi:nucleotide-binding universal stress UspA family protein
MNTEISVSKILLPVEFSERCRGAARYAEALAGHFQAELALLHIVMPPYVAYGEVNAYPPAADFFTQRWDQSKIELDAFLSDAPSGLRLRRTLLDGDPARQIVEYAHAGKFDLIVMPTHGYGPFRRFLLGSVTAKVLHDVNCPVWTGPHLEQAPEWKSFALRRIACALDLGPESRAVLGWAAAMAREFSADLTILHALPASTVSIEGFTFDPEWRLQLEKEAREQIAYLQQELGAGGEVYIEVGDVAPAMRDAARYRNADLLVIGRSHGAGVLGRLRANAYSILREAPCPVVSI